MHSYLRAIGFQNNMKTVSYTHLDVYKRQVHGRAEELSKRKDYRESFDLCVSRAVANLSTLSEYCLPFIHTSGKFISYKSGEVDDELKDAKKAVFVLGGEIEDVIHLSLIHI